jgi:hypothetical protein
VSRVAAPDGGRVAFQLFERGQQTRVGVSGAGGAIVWQRRAGFRPLLSLFWSGDGKSVLLVTDCSQEEAELRSKKAGTASWLMVLDARDGSVTAEGDLDTEVLRLQTKLPDAVGAAHVIDSVTLADGMIEAVVHHREQRVDGRRPLAELVAGGGKR